MSNQSELTRDIIIQSLAGALEHLDFIHAFWEGGAVSHGRIDEWSDIDLYLVVDDKEVDKAFLAVERALRLLSPIKQKYNGHSQGEGLFQAWYRLEGASEYLVVDLAVLTRSTPEKFLEVEIHGKPIFYFNKSDEIKPAAVDKGVLVKKLMRSVKGLTANVNMFNNLVQKEINRGNPLEAMDCYRSVTLASLVEALRIRYSPIHHGFRMRYIHYELPSEISEKLKNLHFVRDEKDLQEKYREATQWFFEIVSEINQRRIEGLLSLPST